MVVQVTVTPRASSIQTFTGKVFDPVNPDPALIDIKDIAHSLSLQCRFNGHVRDHYSVADHSLRVADEVKRRRGSITDRLWALLHDASETYLSDLPSPLKSEPTIGPAYRKLERRVMRAVTDAFDLPGNQPKLVTEADHVLLVTERRDLLQSGRVTNEQREAWTRWLDDVRPLRQRISSFDSEPYYIEDLFLTNFNELQEERKNA